MQIRLKIADSNKYIKLREEYEKKPDDFMCKHLYHVWPKRIVWTIGLLQLLISLAILSLDLVIILMFAPRWQIFAGSWTFLFGFIACVSTIDSTRKMTWLKLKWMTAFNFLAGIAAAVMVAFDMLYLVNPYMCIVISGCDYLSYTYAAVKPYYIGQLILGIFLILTVFLFGILFIKYGISGAILFDYIQKGWTPVVSPFHSTPMPRHSVSRFRVTNYVPLDSVMILSPQNPTMAAGSQGLILLPGPQPSLMIPEL